MADKKILAVDDSRDTLFLIEKILKRTDWQFRGAEDGESALELFDEFQPDVVTLDYTLPEMNGKEVFIELDKRRTNSSIIFLTAHTDEAIVKEFLELGAFGYMTKPIHSAQLLFQLSKAYNHKILKDAYRGLQEKEKDFSRLYSIVEHLSNRGADLELNQRILIDRQRSYALDIFFNLYKKSHPSLTEKISSLEKMGADEFNGTGSKIVMDLKYIFEELENTMKHTADELDEISKRVEKIG